MSEGVRVGVAGLGLMGAVHIRALRGTGARLVSVADPKQARREGAAFTPGNLDATRGDERLFDPASVTGYADASEMIARETLDLVVVCTPTDTHVALASEALRQGMHVLLEKPVATTAGEVAALAEVERGTGGHVIPAMCMRFWPGWAWLRERARDGELGRLRSLKCVRLGSRPAWSAEFYGDDARTGGAIFDLHVHDVDFVMWCLGTPREVTSIGDRDHVTTMYRFEDRGLQVTAEGGWLGSEGRGFRMRCVAEFEDATAEFELGREQPLMVTRGGATTPAVLPGGTAYELQMERVIACVQAWRRGDTAPEQPTLAEAARVTRVVEAEIRSLETGRAVECG
ncbi:MAG: Gfo/Idh/MocA family oxidoreductase [Phycisphaerales bacterium]|jgi:predicted dehydrogenase